MENTTVEKIIIETIRAGDTSLEFKVVVDSSTLLALLVQERFLQRKSKPTMSEAAYIELSEHLYMNVSSIKDSPHFKGVIEDAQLERLIVVKKRFDGKIKEFALKRWKKFEGIRKEAVKAEKERLKAEKKIKKSAGDAMPTKAELEASATRAAEEIENAGSTTKTLTEVKEEFMDRSKMGRRARKKGQEGELKLIKILQPIIDEVFLLADELDQNDIPILHRNLHQTQDGGSDVVGIDFLAIEIKNTVKLNLPKWFEQAKEQAAENQEPVLIYKVNGKWRVMMFGLIACGKKTVRTNVDIDMSAFIVWFELMLKQMLGIEV